MKPTEADIQAELIEGWEIDEYFSPVKNKLRIRKDTLKIAFYDFTFEIALNDSERSGTLRFFSFESFITGNYGLSAISQHYEPEEWQRIITMCERIVRLITGEQVEQSLEEKVREILEPLGLTEIAVEPSVITCVSGWAKREIVSTGVISHHPMNGSCRHEEFSSFDSKYADAYRKVAALLTAEPESEQTLEEAVRGEIMRWNIIKPAILDVFEDHVILDYQHTEYKVFDNCLVVDGETGEFDQISKKKRLTHEFTECMKSIAALLSTRSTKPSYSDLEQRVEELEKLVDEEHRKAKDFHRDSITKSDRITDLEAQLQDYISPADHEREMANCDSLLAKVTLERDQARKDSALHLSWFHREYAKNAEASK